MYVVSSFVVTVLLAAVGASFTAVASTVRVYDDALSVVPSFTQDATLSEIYPLALHAGLPFRLPASMSAFVIT